jgi:hypothetical protein
MKYNLWILTLIGFSAAMQFSCAMEDNLKPIRTMPICIIKDVNGEPVHCAYYGLNKNSLVVMTDKKSYFVDKTNESKLYETQIKDSLNYCGNFGFNNDVWVSGMCVNSKNHDIVIFKEKCIKVFDKLGNLLFSNEQKGFIQSIYFDSMGDLLVLKSDNKNHQQVYCINKINGRTGNDIDINLSYNDLIDIGCTVNDSYLCLTSNYTFHNQNQGSIGLYNASDLKHIISYDDDCLKSSNEGFCFKAYRPCQISNNVLAVLAQYETSLYTRLLIFALNQNKSLELKHIVPNEKYWRFIRVLFYPTTSIVFTLSEFLHRYNNDYEDFWFRLQYWNGKKCLETMPIALVGLINSIDFSPDGKEIAITTSAGCTIYKVPECVACRHEKNAAPYCLWVLKQHCTNLQEQYGLLVPSEIIREIMIHRYLS